MGIIRSEISSEKSYFETIPLKRGSQIVQDSLHIRFLYPYTGSIVPKHLGIYENIHLA